MGIWKTPLICLPLVDCAYNLFCFYLYDELTFILRTSNYCTHKMETKCLALIVHEQIQNSFKSLLYMPKGNVNTTYWTVHSSFCYFVVVWFFSICKKKETIIYIYTTSLKRAVYKLDDKNIICTSVGNMLNKRNSLQYRR